MLPSGFTEQSIGPIPSPTAMTLAPDGRLFVCQQNGQLRVIKNGLLLATPFVTVATDTIGERGLLGVAVDSQFVYIYYTVPATPRFNRLSRFAQNGDVAAGGETVLMDFEPLSATNHNGGAIHFGPDGKLYVAVGENSVASHSQSLSNRLGKMLRLNPDGTIPTDNPFFNSATGLNRSIWALGLRNPFTFAFQPGTGRMFINDVGQSTWEEINEGVAGANYGWPNSEGNTTNPAHRSPIYAYGHSGTTEWGCAIAGGAFYNPDTPTFPAEYAGQYFFADYCSGWIRRLNPGTGQTAGFATNILSPVDLAVSPEGSLYYLARGSGFVHRVDYTASAAPHITQHPTGMAVVVGQSATFTVDASGASPLSYQWQRNGNTISNAIQASYTLNAATAADNGAQFRAVVSNAFGNATSNAAILTVASNQAPTASITAPASGLLYAGGDNIGYQGSGTDPEEGGIPAARICWQIDFHHDTHTHPFVPETCGNASGSVQIPNTGETSANVWYRFRLTVRDSTGLADSRFVDVMPRRANLTLQTNPPEMQLTLDGQPTSTPLQFTSVVGMIRSLGAISPIGTGDTRFRFLSWSDNGTLIHDIATPPSDTTYTASFLAQHRLTVSTAPQASGGIITTPPTVDGYYDSGAVVQLTATPLAGFAFNSWSGSLSGTANPQSITMNAPAAVTAVFQDNSSCSYQVSRTSGSYSGGGDLGMLQLTTLPGCAWNVSAAASWISIDSNAAGNGSTAVRFRLEPNPLAASRTSALTIAGLTYLITQSGAQCVARLPAPSLVVAAGGGAYQAAVETAPGCNWIASAAPDWITVQNGAGGVTGSGPLTFLISTNTSSGARSGAILVSGLALQILQPAANPSQIFSDVPLSHAFHAHISMIRDRSITLGCSPTEFCPGQATSRGQMAAFIIRALLGGDIFPYPAAPFFTDVHVNHPFFPHIQKLRELGITTGCSASLYCPDDIVTRGQMAAFLVRARFGLAGNQAFPFNATPFFDDVPASHPFFAYIQEMRELGITSGCSPSSYCPDSPNLREQMAAFLVRGLLAP